MYLLNELFFTFIKILKIITIELDLLLFINKLILE
ncbi:hypothetical protein c7_L1096 [Megavirus courdo7]|uniref:Uncharacterized protein n=1 Tax=Megavirus courdo7 TaxID=1128135 RepID=H2EC20_9VIRU|nr:hypothetical protein c7_L1096 [Megavirus courdo7]